GGPGRGQRPRRRGSAALRRDDPQRASGLERQGSLDAAGRRAPARPSRRPRADMGPRPPRRPRAAAPEVGLYPESAVEPRPGLALHTDLYELRMAASYLKRAMRAPATFSLFARR